MHGSYFKSIKKYTAGLILLLVIIPAYSQAKNHILKLDIVLSDAGSGSTMEINKSRIEITKRGRMFKKLVQKGSLPFSVVIPLDKEEYTFTIYSDGYYTPTYIFSTFDFDAGTETNFPKYSASFTVKMVKLPPENSSKQLLGETRHIAYNSKTHTIELKKETGNKKVIPLVDYEARFMVTRKNKTQPEGLANGSVLLKDTAGTVLQQTRTNTKGVFVFHQLSPDNKYNVELEKTIEVPDGAKIFMAKLNGTIIQKLEMDKSGKTFAYKLLPSELTKLVPLSADDASLKVLNFSKSAEKEISIAENIYYEFDKWDISPDASIQFDKIVQIMKDNPKLKLEIRSHTDSKGDDDYNLKLSDKRAQTAVDYIVSKGINKKRVSGKGYGESQILNKCKNNVDCTEEEHKENRRTEFHYIKS